MPKYKLLKPYELHPNYTLPVGAVMQMSKQDASPLLANGTVAPTNDDAANKLDPSLYSDPCWPKQGYGIGVSEANRLAASRAPETPEQNAEKPEKR